jgi:hypothetical protein
MSNQETPNNENYDMSTTDMNSVGQNPINSSSVSEIIEATGNVNPTRFWMVFMVGLSICLGSVIFFGGNYLTDEIKSLKEDKKELQIQLYQCPDKTLERFKQQQIELNELKNDVLRNADRLDSIKEGKTRTLEKIQRIDKMQ